MVEYLTLSKFSWWLQETISSGTMKTRSKVESRSGAAVHISVSPINLISWDKGGYRITFTDEASNHVRAAHAGYPGWSSQVPEASSALGWATNGNTRQDNCSWLPKRVYTRVKRAEIEWDQYLLYLYVHLPTERQRWTNECRHWERIF